MRTNGPIQLYPLVRIAIVFALGIFIGDRLWGIISSYTLLVVVILFVAVSLIPKLGSVVQGGFILLSFMALGAFRVSSYEERVRTPLPKEDMEYEAVIINHPEERGKVLKCDLYVTSGYMAGHRMKASILRDTISGRYLHLRLGSGIRAISRIEENTNFRHNSSFNYVRWLEGHGFSARTFIYYDNWQKWLIQLSHIGMLERLRIQALELRDGLLSRMKMPGGDSDAMAVVAAMTWGDRSALTKDLKEIYSISGTSHILALSGFHLSVMAFLLLFVFRRRCNRFVGALMVVLMVWSYVVIVGISPSVVRAAIMLTVYTFVDLLHRDRRPLNTWAFSALVMLVANPLSLWDIGWQLSFMSVLSILLLYRPVYSMMSDGILRRFVLLRSVWAIVSVSISAQVGVAPLVMYYFGRFSCYFILANIIVVPCAWLILYGALFMWLLAFSSVAHSVLLDGIVGVASWMNHSLSVISSWPGACVDNICLTTSQVWLLYALIACLIGIGYYLRKIYRLHRQFHP